MVAFSQPKGFSFQDEIDLLMFPTGLVKLSKDSEDTIQAIRQDFNKLANKIIIQTDVCRAQMLALTNLQQARMWAVQAVVDDQIVSGGEED